MLAVFVVIVTALSAFAEKARPTYLPATVLPVMTLVFHRSIIICIRWALD